MTSEGEPSASVGPDRALLAASVAFAAAAVLVVAGWRHFAAARR